MKRPLSIFLVFGALWRAGTAQAANILIPSGEKNSTRENVNRALVPDFWAKFFSGQTDGLRPMRFLNQ